MDETKKTVSTDGWLAEEPPDWMQRSMGEFVDLFEAAEEVNRIAHATMHNAGFRNNDRQAAFVIGAYLRCMESFQATVLLAQRGLATDAQVLLRSLFLSMCLVTAGAYCEAFPAEWYQHEVFLRLRAINRGLKNGSFLMPDDDLARLVEQQQELEEEVKSGHYKEIKVAELCERVDHRGSYDTMFGVLSGPAHVEMRNVMEHFRFDGEGLIEHVSWGPSQRDLPDTLWSAAASMYSAVVEVADFFGIDLGKARSEVDQQIASLRSRILSEEERSLVDDSPDG